MRGVVRRSLAWSGVLTTAFALALIVPVSETMWGKVLHVHGSVNVAAEREAGTIGFWKNWDRHETFSETEIEAWLAEIDAASVWLGPITVEDMATHFEAATGGEATMQSRFLAHYLATRLNERSGLLDANEGHDVSTLDPGNYRGLTDPHDASLAEIIIAIEAKFPTVETKEEYEILKDIADALNNMDV